MNMRSDRNEFKISFREPRYIVDETNGVVICLLDYTAHSPIMCDYAVYPNYDWPNPLCQLTSKAVVFAKKGDKFDVNIGKKVALAKAENKAYAYTYNYFARGAKDLAKALDAIEDFRDKVDRVKKHNIEYMKRF